MANSGFATKRDWRMLGDLGVRRGSMSADDIARVLDAAPNREGLMPAMALARRVDDAGIDQLLTAAEARISNATPRGLGIGNGDLFFRLLAQRMAPRPGYSAGQDVAEMEPLNARRLADVLEVGAQSAFLFSLNRDAAGLAPGDPRLLELLRRPAPTVAGIVDGSESVDELPISVTARLLGAATLRATSDADVAALLTRAEALAASSGVGPTLAARVNGLLAQRQAGAFRGVAAVDTAAFSDVTALRLSHATSALREEPTYMSGGPGLPPARSELSDAEVATLLAFAESQEGNVGGEVVTREVAAAVARAWLGNPAWFDTTNDPLAALSKHGDNSAAHRVRWSEGKAVSGGVGTLNLLRFANRGGRMAQVANIHLSVPTRSAMHRERQIG